MSFWLVNGRRDAAIAVDDRAVQYGDGVFETIAIRDGNPRFWELHSDRLLLGCARLGIPAPDVGALVAMLQDAIAAGDVDAAHATAKIIVTAGRGERGYRRPSELSPTTIIGVFPSSSRPAAEYRDGVDISVCQTRLGLQPQFAGIKSLNRLEQVLGRNEIDDTRVVEGLMLDTEGRLICGTMSNVFLLIDNTFVTPAITRCGVSGIMRRKLLETLDAQDADFEVRDVDASELARAQGMMLSNSQFGLLPVVKCMHHEWQIPGEIRSAMNAVADAGVEECRP